MKIFNIIFCVLFVVCAILQYNDPDPWVWIPIYLFAAVLCWFAFKGEYYKGGLLTAVIAYGIYAVYLFYADNGVADWITKHNAENIAASMKATKPWIEDTREFFGLCIMLAVMLINYFYAKRRGLLR